MIELLQARQRRLALAMPRWLATKKGTEGRERNCSRSYPPAARDRLVSPKTLAGIADEREGEDSSIARVIPVVSLISIS